MGLISHAGRCSEKESCREHWLDWHSLGVVGVRCFPKAEQSAPNGSFLRHTLFGGSGWQLTFPSPFPRLYLTCQSRPLTFGSPCKVPHLEHLTGSQASVRLT